MAYDSLEIFLSLSPPLPLPHSPTPHHLYHSAYLRGIPSLGFLSPITLMGTGHRGDRLTSRSPYFSIALLLDRLLSRSPYFSIALLLDRLTSRSPYFSIALLLDRLTSRSPSFPIATSGY
ncbi:MAG: hypothetical protein AB4426_05490 [Xenococcaceae cyanobacterium]